MPFKTIDPKEVAKKFNINYFEVEQKQKLIEQIIKLRNERGLSQAVLASIIGVSQSRIAQIESGIGTAKISFDVLLNIFYALGFSYEVRLKKIA